jgi:hypothetical protein
MRLPCLEAPTGRGRRRGGGGAGRKLCGGYSAATGEFYLLDGEFPGYGKFGEMTTVPGRAGRRIACGLAVIMATFLTVLAGESPAGAGTDAHTRGIQHVASTRDIRNEENTRNTGKAGSAKKARKAVRPWTIEIPSIGVAADLMTLGGPSGSDGQGGLSLPVPPLAKAAIDAGWYQFTSVPGSAGNAVIVGHVDTYVGPAVFYNLYLLRPGDSIYVSTGGARQSFTVTSVREMPKSSFPVNQVFGSTESTRCGLSRAAAHSTTRRDITWKISSYRRYGGQRHDLRRHLVPGRSGCGNKRKSI